MAPGLSKDYSSHSNYSRALSYNHNINWVTCYLITLASWILLSLPIVTVVRSYFNEVDRASDIDSPVSWSETLSSEGQGSDKLDEIGTGKGRDFFESSDNVTLARKPDNNSPVLTRNKESIDCGSRDVASQKPDSSMLSGNSSSMQEQDHEKPVQSKNEESIDIGSDDSALAKSEFSPSAKDKTLQERGTENPVQTDN